LFCSYGIWLIVTKDHRLEKQMIEKSAIAVDFLMILVLHLPSKKTLKRLNLLGGRRE